MVFRLNKSLAFPDPSLADDDGWLAIGGDLSPERLLLAYQNGIFPWFSEGDPICWYSPHARFVLFADEVHISHSMQKLIRSAKYNITEDTAFAEVVSNCSVIERPCQTGTWITADMKEAYITLHQKGIAHSVEIWHKSQLIGGIYGVVIDRVFCGESMFSLMPSASKLAMIHLCQSGKYDIIDCQLHTPHLESMGGRYLSRTEYMQFFS
ncbi:MAG: leucyl/phenylalanyl-tRNA--protein transferase [Bacteroidetes bacterium]|nr:leucyl/phenylalanyl-tRNA--protein transferase [Bacteroidota bacterium]